MRQASADRAARADGGVADPADRLMQQGLGLGQAEMALHGCLARHRPDCRTAVTGRDVRQLGHPVQVNEQSWLSQTKVEERDQALATRQQFRFRAALSEHRHGLVDGYGSDVVERWWLHVARTGERRQDTPPRGQGPKAPQTNRCGRRRPSRSTKSNWSNEPPGLDSTNGATTLARVRDAKSTSSLPSAWSGWPLLASGRRPHSVTKNASVSSRSCSQAGQPSSTRYTSSRSQYSWPARPS